MASTGSLVDTLGGKTTDGKSRALWCWGEMGWDMMGSTGAMGTLYRDQLMMVGRSSYRTRAWKYRCYRVFAVGTKCYKRWSSIPSVVTLYFLNIFFIQSWSVFVMLQLTQVSTMVFKLLRELICVGRFGRNHFPLFRLLQHSSVPVISTDSTHHNPILRGRRCKVFVFFNFKYCVLERIWQYLAVPRCTRCGNNCNRWSCNKGM